MFDIEAIQKHVQDRVQSVELELEPFPHFYVTDFLPGEAYAELLANLPDDSDYRRYKPPYEARLFLNLEPKEVSKLDRRVREFWVEFEAWINSQAFLDLMVRRFGPLLKSNAHERKAQLRKAANGGDLPIWSRTLLARDYAHFSLGPHTDAKNKFITALYYLPKDDSFKRFGTSIYAPKKSGYTSWESEHHKHEDFKLVRTFENRPNSFFAFMKSDRSFHGVEPGDYPNFGRDLIMWFPEIAAEKEAGRRLSLSRSVFEDAKKGFVRSLVERVTG